MFLSRLIKALDTSINSKNYEQAEAKLVDISQSLIITYFIPTESKFKNDLLPTILQKVLPITYNEQLNLRLQAESFLIHWYSLLSSFSPVYLLEVYQSLQTVTLQPAAQASLLTFLTNALHYISPELREDYLGTCHSLLLSSQPEFLNHLTQSDWRLLADTFSLQIIPSLVKFLLNTPLSVAVVTLLKKDPENIIPIITGGSNLQFLKDVIPLIPTSIYISIKLLKDRLFEALKSQNSQEIGGAIEVIILLINRPRIADDKDGWKEVFGEINVLWNTTKVLSQKSAIVDLYTSAAKNSMIPIDALHRFMLFDTSTPTVLSVAFLRCGAYYVKVRKQIPKGLINFLKTNSIERDPLLFVATIEFLVECFNEFYTISPKSAEKILDYCLNPLPKYFVEQNAIIRLIKNIDFDVFPISKLRTNVLEIILRFINKPHPSVIPEILSLIDHMKIILPYTELDWFEKAPSYLTLLPYCDPLFITELLDFGLLTAATYPEAVISIADELTEKDAKVSELLFNRCLYVILEAINILKIDFQTTSSIKKLATKEWSHFCKQLPEMLSMINDNLPNTPFGKVIDSSIYLLATTVNFIEFPSTRAFDLLEIAKIFGTAFTNNSCKLVNAIAKKFKEIRIQTQISQFFEKIFPYDAAVFVSHSALDCLSKYQFECVSAYMKVAANTDRSILLRFPNKNKIDNYRTFLVLKNDPTKLDYINQCIKTIPFEDWIIEEDDIDFLKAIKQIGEKIHVKDLTFLDQIHLRVVKECPELFIVDKETVYDETNILDSLPDELNVGQVVPDEYDDDLLDNEVQPTKEPDEELISPYECFVPNRSLLLSFLWFSSRRLPNSETEEKVEKYARNQAITDPMFGLAFLCYASRLKMSIDIDKWISVVSVNRNNNYSIFEFIVLTNFIRKKWSELTEKELNFIVNSSSELGVHDLSEYNLARIYKESEGTLRKVVDSIISIDPTRFEEFPLFPDMFIEEDFDQFVKSGKLDMIFDMMKDEANSPLLYESLTLLSRHLLPIPPVLPANSFDIPRDVPCLSKFYQTKIAIEELPQYDPPSPFSENEGDNLIEKMLSFFEENRTLDYFLFQLIFKFKLNREQYMRIVLVLKTFSHNNPVRIHLALKYISLVESNTNFTSLQIDDVKPPSFTRQFVAAMVSPYCPKLPSKEITGFCAKLKPVLFDLLFVGFDEYSEKLFDHSFKPNYTSALLFKNLSSSIVSTLKGYCSCINSGGVIVSKQLLQLDYERLCNYYNTNSYESAILDICSSIIDSAIVNDCAVCYLCQDFNTVLDHASPMEIYMSVIVEKVLNAPQLLSVFIIVRMFLKRLEMRAKEEEIQNQKNRELAEADQENENKEDEKETQENENKEDENEPENEKVENETEKKEETGNEAEVETKEENNNETPDNEKVEKDESEAEKKEETVNESEAEKKEETVNESEAEKKEETEAPLASADKDKKKKRGFFLRKGKDKSSTKEKEDPSKEKESLKESKQPPAPIIPPVKRDIIKEIRAAKESWEMAKEGLPSRISDKERVRLLFCDNVLEALAEIMKYNAK